MRATSAIARVRVARLDAEILSSPRTRDAARMHGSTQAPSMHACIEKAFVLSDRNLQKMKLLYDQDKSLSYKVGMAFKWCSSSESHKVACATGECGMS